MINYLILLNNALSLLIHSLFTHFFLILAPSIISNLQMMSSCKSGDLMSFV